MTDSARPNLLRLGRDANERVNFALFEQGDCLGRGPSYEFDIARRSEANLPEKDSYRRVCPTNNVAPCSLTK